MPDRHALDDEKSVADARYMRADAVTQEWCTNTFDRRHSPASRVVHLDLFVVGGRDLEIRAGVIGN